MKCSFQYGKYIISNSVVSKQKEFERIFFYLKFDNDIVNLQTREFVQQNKHI